MRICFVPLFVFLLLFQSFIFSQATQTFSGGATGAIPDDQQWHYYNLNIAALNASPINTNWGLEKVTLNISHTWDADLEVWLGSPDGTETMLFSGVGGSGNNFSNTSFKNTYTTPIATGSAPFTGNYKPMGDLGTLNNGQSGLGVWYLKIRDGFAQDQGSLNSWSIRFGASPAIPYPPVVSNLPLVLINTNGQPIPDDPKLKAEIRIIENPNGQLNHSTDTVYSYFGIIGIEQRGSSSGSAPKKSYGFETWGADSVEIDTSILAMPAQSDWILSASYYDKTLMRNVLSYHLASQTGHYAPRTRYCEVLLNGQYQGVYVMMEKIKRDENRVDIAKLNPGDTTGDELTGGYILKIDKFTGSGGEGFYSLHSPSNPSGDTVFIQYEYPKGSELHPKQAAYIQQYVDSFEDALYGPNFQDPVNGFRKYASEKSFIDYLFINEMSKNVDGYRLSTFFHKDKQSNGGKIKMGPVWDYDIAWYNADYCGGNTLTGWAYDMSYVCSGSSLPAWWERLRQDSLFNQHLYCRWNYLRSTVFSFDSVFAYIDSTVAYLQQAQQRNFITWNILGVATWPEPTPIPQTYDEEVLRLKNWISNRFAYLDTQFGSLAHHPVPVSVGNDTGYCNGTQLVLATTPEYDTYQWNTGNTSETQLITQGGYYSVTVQDNFQCSGTDAIQVTELPSPLVDLGNDTTLCEGNSVTLSASNGTQYQWSNGSHAASVSINQPNTYSVTVTGANSCTAADGVNVYIQPLPDATFYFTDTMGATVQFLSADTSNVSSWWYFGNGDSSNLFNPLYDFSPGYGDFLVTHIVTDGYGCATSDTATIHILGTSISPIDAEGLSIYPNPSSSMIYISCAKAIEQIKMTDALGNTVRNSIAATGNQMQLDIHALAAGIYFIEITSQKHAFIRKLIKQ